jgi:hypothetical protein
MNDRDPDRIIYWAENLLDGRGQLHRDVVIDDEVDSSLSGPVGSPAPIAFVKAAEYTLVLR